MDRKTKEQRKADAEAAQELLNSPAFNLVFDRLSTQYLEGVLNCAPGHDAMFSAVHKLQSIKAIREELQSAADDLKMLRGDGTT